MSATPWPWVAGAVVALLLLFCIADCGGGRVVVTNATVLGGRHSPAHSVTTVECGDHGFCHPKTTFYPDRWALRLFTVYDLGQHWVDCDEKVYNAAMLGTAAHTTFRRGRISGLLWGPFGVDLDLPAERAQR